MPLKIKFTKNSFSVKALIISTAICLVHALIFGILSLVGNGQVGPDYPIFCYVFLGANVLYAVMYGFVLRHSKVLYVIFTILAFLGVFVTGAMGYLFMTSNNAIFVHVAWALALMTAYYFLGELLANDSLFIRFYGPGVIHLLGLLFVFVLVDKVMISLTANVVIASILLGIAGIFLLIMFISVLIAMKDILSKLHCKFVVYDSPTEDESELYDRENFTTNMDRIPRIYEGDVSSFTDDVFEGLAKSLEKYLKEGEEALSYVAEYVNGGVETQDELNSFIKWRNSTIDSFNKDAKDLQEFIIKMAKHVFLDDVHKGKKFIYDFQKYKIEIKNQSDKDDFGLSFMGFYKNVSYSFPHGAGTVKSKANFDPPRPSSKKIGYHRAEVDRQVDDPRYFLPGTPMPVEDDEL